MKYNRSEIMKAAWRYYRGMMAATRNFACALRRAWREAKEAIQEAKKIAFDGSAVEGDYYFKLWEKDTGRYTIRRVYCNGRNGRKGYIDLRDNEIVATGSVAFACAEFLKKYSLTNIANA